YDFLYFYCQKGNSRNKIRRCLHVLGIDTSDVLDIIFPFHNIVGILVHKDDRTKICKILAKQANIKPIKNFNPMDPAYLGTNKDPHVSDEEQVAKLFKKHKKRCIHTLNFVPKAYFSPILVAFMSKGWLT
ncbi:uncharacterized protein BX663DRAFT_414867, partial [Cokeromyces recurvatus]|uniref:uncharacterized protein n=1 Tax=Cokeromyces recurvatus TaxID=90255 RepID=UPI00222127C6